LPLPTEAEAVGVLEAAGDAEGGRYDGEGPGVPCVDGEDAVAGEGEATGTVEGETAERVGVGVTLGVRVLLPVRLMEAVMDGVTDWLAPVLKEAVGETEMLGVLEGVADDVGVRVTAVGSTAQVSVAPEPEPV